MMLRNLLNQDYNKLIKQLNAENYGGVIRYSGFVEPLLDKNIYNLIFEAKSIYQMLESN